MNYYDYLKTEHWANLRQEALDHYGYNCLVCNNSKNINVHHLVYRDLYSVKVNDLRVVCEYCHDQIHKIFDNLPIDLKRDSPDQVWNVCIGKYKTISKDNTKFIVTDTKKVLNINKNYLRMCKNYFKNILNDLGYFKCPISDELVIEFKRLYPSKNEAYLHIRYFASLNNLNLKKPSDIVKEKKYRLLT